MKILPHYTDSQVRDALEKLYAQKLISKHGGNRNRTYSRNLSELEFIKSLEAVTEKVKQIYTRSKKVSYKSIKMVRIEDFPLQYALFLFRKN